MYRNLSLVTAPTGDPVTVAEAKSQARIELADEDDQIEAWIEAATAHLDGRDGILSRALMTQTWDYTLPRFPIADYIELPLAPVQSITSITYKDADGNTQTFAASDYRLSADLHMRPKVILAHGKSWPAHREEADAVKIRAVYGYTLVPMPIRQAIVLLVAHFYVNREAVLVGESATELPFGVRALLEPYLRAAF